MAWSYTGRTTIVWTDTARPSTGYEGRFHFGQFGKARFGISDSWTRIPRTSNSKSAIAGIAIAGIAVAGTISQGWVPISRPSQ